jgi:hypothetical protein
VECACVCVCTIYFVFIKKKKVGFQQKDGPFNQNAVLVSQERSTLRVPDALNGVPHNGIVEICIIVV